MLDSNSKYNPWSKEDEKEHFPCLDEWWALEAFFTSIDDNKKWSLKVALTEYYENEKKQGSVANITLFDQDEDKQYEYHKRDNKNRLKSDKDKLFVRFGKSYMKGAFPIYEIRSVDPDNDIEINLKLEAKSYPHWIAQDITDGWLPMGLGLYRYGYIPNCKLTGTLKIKNKTHKIKGLGYWEHVWGDFDYDKPINPGSLKKIFSTYVKLVGWWIKKRRIKIPKTITFSSDNNPFGYDWAWAVLDNDWTLFYGNSMFWIMDGPGMGTLILSKDGKNYTEFNDLIFHYKKTKHVKKYDFFYPTEFELNAKKGKEKIFLDFKMTNKPREFISIFPYAKLHWIGLSICESPGIVKGYYTDGKNKTKLSGVAKLEPQRQLTTYGHFMLKLDFRLPPKKLGIDIDFKSHHLKKQIKTQIHLLPKPKIKFSMKKN